MKALERIKEFKPCNEAVEWLGEERTIEQMVNECDRGDWLLWLAKKADLDLRKLTLAKALCVRQIEHLLTDERSINALNVAERFGRGEAERYELDDAADDAAAYDAADDAAAYAAAYAAASSAATSSAAARAAASSSDAADATRQRQVEHLIEMIESERVGEIPNPDKGDAR